MARTDIASLKGPRGLTGNRGLPGAADLPADAAVAEYVRAETKTQAALMENYVASPAVVGRLRAAFQARILKPLQMVFLGSSTTLGTGASQSGSTYGAGLRMVDRVLAAVQSRFPSGLGTETTIVPIADAPFGRPGAHGYNGGVGGITAVQLLDDGRLARIAAIQPDVVWIVIGANDYSNAYAPATFRANVQTRLAEMRAVMKKPTVFVLVHSWKREDVTSPVAAWEDYGAVLREIAANAPDDVAFINAQTAFELAGSFTDDPYAMFTFDLVHGTDRAHGLLAEEMVRGVIPTGTRDPQLNPLIGYVDFGAGAASTAPSPLRGGGWEYANGSGQMAVDANGWGYSTGAGVAGFDIGRQYCTVRAKMKRPLSGVAGIGGRMVDANNRLTLYIDPAANRLILAGQIAGSNNQYASVPENSAPGTELELMIVITSNRVHGYLNGQLLLSHTLTTEHISALQGGTKVFIRQGVAGAASTGYKDITVVTGSTSGLKPLGTDTDWVYLTPEPAFAGSVVKARMVDGLVEVRINANGDFPAGATTIASDLPASMRPSDVVRGVCTFTGGHIGSTYTGSGGTVGVVHQSGGTRQNASGNIPGFMPG